MYALKHCKNCPASASSATRRSTDTRAVIKVATRGAPRRTPPPLLPSAAFAFEAAAASLASAASAAEMGAPGSTVRTPPPTAMMHAWGGLITALNSVTPNMPKLLTLKVPPWNSCGSSFPTRARPASSLTVSPMSP